MDRIAMHYTRLDFASFSGLPQEAFHALVEEQAALLCGQALKRTLEEYQSRLEIGKKTNHETAQEKNASGIW